MQEVSTKLGIQNAGRKNSQCRDRQNRNDRNKQVSNDQPVTEAPEQPVSPPADQPEQEQYACNNRQVFQEADSAALQAKHGGQQHSGCQCTQPSLYIM